jgi:hypothetical protein
MISIRFILFVVLYIGKEDTVLRSGIDYEMTAEAATSIRLDKIMVAILHCIVREEDDCLRAKKSVLYTRDFAKNHIFDQNYQLCFTSIHRLVPFTKAKHICNLITLIHFPLLCVPVLS